jgi:hypothetical protein
LPQVTTKERLQWEESEAELTAKIDQLKSELKEKATKKTPSEAIEEKNKLLESQRVAEPMVRALWDRGQPSPTYLLRRGDYRQPARLVGPGVPSVLTTGRIPFEPEPPWDGAKKTGNRLALAKWLTKPDHPLTARVIVNRIWKHHFGVGIVKTLDDFGHAGAKPSHPELLDWLAIEFVRSGWRIKHLHRLMMMSATYRRTSDSTPDQQRLDIDNRLLSRMQLRRMEAEVLRDTLLSVAGKLDLTPFGPPDSISASSDGLVISDQQDAGRRRSIYILKRRTQRLTLFENFDRPAMSPNCIDRPVSIVTPQALFLMNNKMVQELSQSFAQRVLDEAGSDDVQIIRKLFMIAVGRLPSDQEQKSMLAALPQLESSWRDKLSENTNPSDLEHAIAIRAVGNLCHVIMNSAAFLYID